MGAKKVKFEGLQNLYDRDGFYTDAGRKLREETTKALVPLIKKYGGTSPQLLRDVQIIMSGAVDFECTMQRGAVGIARTERRKATEGVWRCEPSSHGKMKIHFIPNSKKEKKNAKRR